MPVCYIELLKKNLFRINGHSNWTYRRVNSLIHRKKTTRKFNKKDSDKTIKKAAVFVAVVVFICVFQNLRSNAALAATAFTNLFFYSLHSYPEKSFYFVFGLGIQANQFNFVLYL